ncbi:MAG: YjjG family noncanonical pyrimidine nucleotidase [Flavobacteriales bacterium]|nr:YjjG family noncanonical pyrimidine nucleotidase [Flavobacteriales bacterium]PWM12090.1 MAG: noncanonical pyrimidine nucleotidase, YjjG family [Flavobacteriales bacterium]
MAQDKNINDSGISTLFFDLDHTLWDFELNSSLALEETLENLSLVGRNGLTAENFIKRYHVINDRMWDQYRRGKIEKSALRSRRFDEALALFSIRENGLAERFADMYLSLCPVKKNLFPGAQDVLENLSARYPVWLLTNGFSEVQAVKIENPGIKPYISGMVTSEEAGAKKPSREIFDYAVKRAGAEASSSAMIGDDLENDVHAALAAGFARAVWFNPSGSQGDVSDSRISVVKSLEELAGIF